jgi:8-oxo-dGTP pyrophosphatase MutT (NUDIX family)
MPPSEASARDACEIEPLRDHLVISCENLAKYWQAGRGDARIKARIKQDAREFEISMAMNLQNFRVKSEPLLRRILHLYWRLARGMTLGVRAVVLDGDNRVFLVKHSYVAGWHLPGGGVEVGETFLGALRRELMEEGRIEVLGEPALHGLFFNNHASRRDHVAVYLVRHFRQDRLPEANREIVACGFFEAGALPEDTTEGTRLRLAEVLENSEPIATWR